MKDELRNAFDKIQAGSTLKKNTAHFLQEKINKRSRVHLSFRLAKVITVMLLLILVSGFSYNLYFTPDAYVAMDVNPSIGLALNRFGHVIEMQAYNEDGALVLENTDVRFKTYDEAARILLDAIIAKGYLAENGLVSVTVQAGSDRENTMLAGLRQTVAMSLEGHHAAAAQADIYAVTDEVRLKAEEHHVTPAKYLAITELQEVDPAATFEGSMEHSISQLQEWTREHGREQGHHSQDGETNNVDTEAGAEPTPAELTPAEPAPTSRPMGGHHGGRRNGHD